MCVRAPFGSATQLHTWQWCGVEAGSLQKGRMICRRESAGWGWPVPRRPPYDSPSGAEYTLSPAAPYITVLTFLNSSRHRRRRGGDTCCVPPSALRLVSRPDAAPPSARALLHRRRRRRRVSHTLQPTVSDFASRADRLVACVSIRAPTS